jgi:hypothetical protein
MPIASPTHEDTATETGCDCYLLSLLVQSHIIQTRFKLCVFLMRMLVSAILYLSHNAIARFHDSTKLHVACSAAYRNFVTAG